MNVVARNIVDSMENNIFSVALKDVDRKILEEVPFFRNILIQNLNNNEVFHGYINRILEAWRSILNDNFKRLISHYNDRYNMDILRGIEKQNKMVELAQQYMADNLFSEFEDLEVSGSLSSLIKTFKTSGISKRKPPSRKRNVNRK